MIPFDELILALERHRRRQAGEQVGEAEQRPTAGPRAQQAWRGAEPSSEINLDEVEPE